MKNLILICIFFLSVHSCKTNNGSSAISSKKKEANTEILINLQESKRVYAAQIIDSIKTFMGSENLEPNGGATLEENDSKIFIEILQEMKTSEKNILYTISTDVNNKRTDKTYSFFFNRKSDLQLVVEKLSSNKQVDSIFYKAGKIYFWPTKKANDDENHQKEKELMLILDEIKPYE